MHQATDAALAFRTHHQLLRTGRDLAMAAMPGFATVRHGTAWSDLKLQTALFADRKMGFGRSPQKSCGATT